MAEETTESWGGHLVKFKWFFIAKIEFLWRAFKFKRSHGLPTSATYVASYILHASTDAI